LQGILGDVAAGCAKYLARSVVFVFCSLKLIISEEICGRFGRFDVEIDAYRLSREVGASWWIDDESDKLHCFAAFVVFQLKHRTEN
jgi:hypothetical protein